MGFVKGDGVKCVVVTDNNIQAIGADHATVFESLESSVDDFAGSPNQVGIFLLR